MSEVNRLNIPRYDELSIKKVYPTIIAWFQDLEVYFPHYDDDYVPPRNFFWPVFNTLHPEVVKTIIGRSHTKRIEGDHDEKGEKIHIWDDIWS